MLGRSHAVSGAAAWAGLLVGAHALGMHPTGPMLSVGCGVCAGFALLPDLDHPKSLIAGTFGPVTRGVARGLAGISRLVYLGTRTRPKVRFDRYTGTRRFIPGDARKAGTHRYLTHTWPFALVVGLVVSLACALGGKWGVGVMAFISCGLALRGLLSNKERRRNSPIVMVAFSAAAAVGCAWLPDGGSWAWLGLPAGVGCYVHALGDALTEHGSPILWPIVWRNQRWHRFAPPRLFRFSTGEGFETNCLMPLFAAAAFAAGFYALRGMA